MSDETQACETLQQHYRFRQPQLLRCALTHRSCSGTQGDQEHNERLEFLGDAVLELVISDWLFAEFPHEAEGVLTRMRAHLVSRPRLAEVARELHLGTCLRLGPSEQRAQGMQRDSILSGTLEALIAAIYLDSCATEHLDAVRHVIRAWFTTHVEALRQAGVAPDSKSALQELMQKHRRETVHYETLAEHGPPHARFFEVGVFFAAEELARGCGASKKQAEQEAARKALASFK